MKNFTRAVDHDVSIGADHDGEAFCPAQLHVTAAASHGGQTRIWALVGDSPGRDNQEGEEEEVHLRGSRFSSGAQYPLYLVSDSQVFQLTIWCHLVD